jgi:hypothetical protein
MNADLNADKRGLNKNSKSLVKIFEEGVEFVSPYYGKNYFYLLSFQ